MKIFDIGGYSTFLGCLANIMKIHRLASLTPGSDNFFKAVTYVTWHNK